MWNLRSMLDQWRLDLSKKTHNFSNSFNFAQSNFTNFLQIHKSFIIFGSTKGGKFYLWTYKKIYSYSNPTMEVTMKISVFTILNEPFILWGSQMIRRNNFNQKLVFHQYFRHFPGQNTWKHNGSFCYCS